MKFYMIWAIFSLLGFGIGWYFFLKAQRRWIVLGALYLIAQPFSWTLMGVQTDGSSIALYPDIAAILEVCTKGLSFLEGAAILLPPFVGTLVAYTVAALLLFRRRPDLLRDAPTGFLQTPHPDDW